MTEILSGNSQPNPFQFPKKKEDQLAWFRQNIQYYMGFYNVKRFFPGEKQETMLSPVEQMDRFMRYYLGRQGNYDYKWSTKDVLERDLPVIYISGQKLGTIMEHLDNTGKKIVRNMKVTVEAVSQAAQNKKTRILEALRNKVELKEDYAEFEQFGVGYKPVGEKDKDFLNMNEAERWVNKDYKEKTAIVGQKLAVDIFKRNHLAEKGAQALKMARLVGLTATHRYAYKGKIIVDNIDPRQLIWDNTGACENDQFNRKAEFAGFLEYLTPSYVMHRWSDQIKQQDPKAADDIQSMNGSNYLSLFPTIGLINGCNVDSKGARLSKVTIYWKGRRNLGWKQATENEWGRKRIYRAKEGEDGDFYDECVYQGTLIANRWLVDCGVAPNQVKNLYDPSESDLPIKVFAPNITMGQTISLTSRIHQIQDFCDYLLNEIKKKVAQSTGRNWVLFADMFDGDQNPASFRADLESVGYTFANRHKGDGDRSDSAMNKIGEVIDNTLDPNIQMLYSLRQEEERMMESIAGISPIVTGQQNSYVSRDVQAGTIQQSSISATGLVEDFVSYWEIVLQDATNAAKIVYSLEDGKQVPVVSETGIEWLQATKDLSLEDLGVQIRVLDIIDEQGRLRLQQIALGMLQNNQQLSLADWVIIEKAQTYTEIMDYLEILAARQHANSEKQAAIAEIQAQVQMEMQAQMNRESVGAGLQKTQMQVEGKNRDTDVKAQADLEKTLIQQAGQKQVA